MPVCINERPILRQYPHRRLDWHLFDAANLRIAYFEFTHGSSPRRVFTIRPWPPAEVNLKSTLNIDSLRLSAHILSKTGTLMASAR